MAKKTKPELAIGGQAVIEGVLMRTTDKYAVAVRQPNGRIIVKKEKYVSATKKHKLLGWPFVRGIIILGETLALGYKALSYSANQQLEEEMSKKEKKHFKLYEAISMVIGIGLAILLFKLIPVGVATLFKNMIATSNLAFNLIDGGVKLLILILYLLLISLMKDVKRLFQYHGAEHKTVHCYEANKKLSVEKVQKYSTAHPRCGTTFLLIVIFLSIVFYLFIPLEISFWLKFLIRLPIILPVAAIAYEWIKLTGKHPHSIISKVLSAPGLLVQRLTTREPDDKQIEVAIKALKAVVD